MWPKTSICIIWFVLSFTKVNIHPHFINSQHACTWNLACIHDLTIWVYMLLYHLKSLSRIRILSFIPESLVDSLGLKKLLNVEQCHCGDKFWWWYLVPDHTPCLYSSFWLGLFKSSPSLRNFYPGSSSWMLNNYIRTVSSLINMNRIMILLLVGRTHVLEDMYRENLFCINIINTGQEWLLNSLLSFQVYLSNDWIWLAVFRCFLGFPGILH